MSKTTAGYEECQRAIRWLNDPRFRAVVVAVPAAHEPFSKLESALRAAQDAASARDKGAR